MVCKCNEKVICDTFSPHHSAPFYVLPNYNLMLSLCYIKSFSQTYSSPVMLYNAPCFEHMNFSFIIPIKYFWVGKTQFVCFWDPRDWTPRCTTTELYPHLWCLFLRGLSSLCWPQACDSPVRSSASRVAGLTGTCHQP